MASDDASGDAEQRQQSPRSSPEPRRRMGSTFTMAERLLIPLLVATIAFAASFSAAKIANNGAADNQRAQLEEQHRKDDREKKYEIYLDFINAVAGYAEVFHAQVQCLRQASPCDVPQNPSAERQLVSALSKIAVYGSNAAVDTASTVYSAMHPFGVGPRPADLPAGAWPQERHDLLPAPATSTAPNPNPDPVAEYEGRYHGAYDSFLHVMCRELPANPRSGC